MDALTAELCNTARDGTTRASDVTAISYPEQHWDGLTVQVDLLQGPGRHLAQKCAECPWLAVCLETRGGQVEMQSQPHGQKAKSRRGAAELYLVPAGKPVWECADNITFARRIFIFFDAVKLQKAGHNMTAIREVSQLAVFSDPVIRQLAAMLADETQQGGPNGRIYGESLAHALTAALLSITERAQKPAKGGLAPRALQRVTAYLEEHWREQLFLADLARLAGISQSHFGRAFKTSTGVAPSRWHMNIRIRRAQEMLLAEMHTLADVALYAGFSDQSHFTRAFRQVAGCTPGAWRKAQQG